MRRTLRWAVPVAAALVPLGILLPAWAQKADDRPPGDVNQAREMARLLEQGQIGLADATRIAEQHVKGYAIQARCEIQRGPAPQDGAPPAEQMQPAADARLVYDVSCFARESQQIQKVQIDGLTKKVVTAEKTPAQP